MNIIEIDSGNKILRRQSIPDDWTVEDGVVISAAGHRVFPPTTRWYAALPAARDGGTYDPVADTYTPPPGPTIEQIRERQIAATVAEASRRRQLVLDSIGPGGLADFVSLTARTLASVRREVSGRGKPGESDRLDMLEILAGQIDAIDKARDALNAEIEASADPGLIDVTDHQVWPNV